METAKIPHIEPEQMKPLATVQTGDYVLRRGAHSWTYVQVTHTTKTQIVIGNQRFTRNGKAIGNEYGPSIQAVKKTIYEDDLKREALQPLVNRVRVAIYAAHDLYARHNMQKVDAIDFAFEVDDLEGKIAKLEALVKELVIDFPDRAMERYRQRNASR